MNKIYKLIWNAQLGGWQAVSELARSHSTSSGLTKTKNSTTGIIQKVSSSIFLGLALLPLSIHAAILNTEIPTGAQINSGSAQISQTGTTLNIQQNSQNLSTNWNTFNIGQDATVNFLQPNQSAVAINHVLDSNASQIMGRLNANGQVFLLNPNGIVFSKTAQVNVGGLVASTLDLNDAEIENGKFTFKGNANSTATIENNGSIQTLQGGTVALIAPNVKNTGTITTPNGVTHLTAASQVTLALQDGTLTQYQVDQGVLQGLVDNGGAIIADNGSVYLTAKAKDSLSKAVVNHTGIIEANRLTQNAKGEIILLGDMQVGQTNVSGTLKAEGKNCQDGGFIETSAAKVNIDKAIKVSTLSDGGSTGEWLIDPYNIVISNATDTGTGFTASQDNTVINATTLNNALATTGVTVSTGGTAVGTQEGNITVDADLSWTSNSTLTLQADKDIHLNKKITATNGGLNLNAANNISATDAINVGTFTLVKGNWLQNSATLPSFYARDFRLSGGSFIRALGGDGTTASPWQLTDIYGVQGMGTKLNGNFTLANDIEASGTVNWNSGAGFKQIGSNGQSFTGTLDGLSHTINGLTINRPNEWGVGLIGAANNSTIQNLEILNANISGNWSSGILLGYGIGNITIKNVATSGVFNARNNIYFGGIIGAFDGGGNLKLSNSFSSATINANSRHYVGGLVGGKHYGNGSGNLSIDNSYFSGQINNGGDSVGGLVGVNFLQYLTDTLAINNSYVTGKVSGSTNVGGLVGSGTSQTTINNSFWNTETTGQTQALGNNIGTLANVASLTTAQMQNLSTFTNAGWDIDSTGGTGKVWRIYDGLTAPLLRSFLSTLDLNTLNQTTTYNGAIQSLATVNGLNNLLLANGNASGRNAGTYTANYYSNQFGYDLIGNSVTLTINKAVINAITGIIANNKTYDGLTQVSLNTSNAQFKGMIAGDDLTVASAIGQLETANAGKSKTVSILDLSLGGADAQNYSLLNTTALTNADIDMQYPEAYLQAIQFKRPRYLPDTFNVLNNVNIETEQGVINTTGIKTLAGEH